ncbi:unnamed protein product [Ilex paraguariensis]|uniref:Lipoxygenase n=1 Tax=Ilex paraguariensis TaxID=185542 RepID=A0ABC8ULG8_9AQUA
MEVTKEILGASFMLNRYSLSSLTPNVQQKNKLLPCSSSSPFFLPCPSSSPFFLSPHGRKEVQLRKMVRAVPMAVHEEEKSIAMFEVTALVTVKNSKKLGMKDLMLNWFDSFKNAVDRSVVLQLVSTEVDPETLKPKLSKEAVLDWSKKEKLEAERLTFKVEFNVDYSFGKPGAIFVSNKYERELFLESIVFEGLVHFTCNSWVQPAGVNKEKRIFFPNMAYLPCQTPVALKELREKELKELRGDGNGLRLLSDRIYEYDMYHDLGNPDKGPEYARPTLGGEKNPHPRRCRTGRPPTNTNIYAESPVNKLIPMYVPRDEALEDTKREDFSVAKLKGLLRNVIPSLKATLPMENDVFKGFSDVKNTYRNKPLEMKSQKQRLNNLPFPKVFSKLQESMEELFKFDPPKNLSGDTSCSLRDDEFGRQAVAGINPLSIEKLKVFPPVSKLDPAVYGPPESALRKEHILGHLNGLSIQEAIDANQLFLQDYHDAYLPFLDRINALDGRKAYATRTLFFLTPIGTLKPIAIELSLPPADSNCSSRRVLSPPVDATTNWLWQLGKAHVCSNDAGVHQLVHHWLRTHACMEPFIISAHRQLSVMHPVFKLLDPHMRYTLEINAMAREYLINAGGVIESSFTPGKYCMEISCAAYRDWWRFDMEGLPADLMRRGVALPDLTLPHGLRLLIEDYPYANDGLLIWSAINSLIQTYVNYYYPEARLVQEDIELLAWYNESINVGHADCCQATWWPKLSNADDLTRILTTLIWLTSAQHAALNFGQYPYGGYVPTRPPLMRRLIPEDHDPEYADFVADPHGYFLLSLPTLSQATEFMAVIDILSAHSRDEEYIGQRHDLATWSGDPIILEAFYKFSIEIKKIEKEIERRNSDPSLRNRCGAGIAPYELLIPSSGPGVTGRGVPNSISV